MPLRACGHLPIVRWVHALGFWLPPELREEGGLDRKPQELEEGATIMMEEETSNRPCHTNDPVYAPAHYAGDGKIECKAAMGSMMAGYDSAAVCSNVAYWCGCAFKYLWRWPLKNNREDLRKARECIDIALSLVGE